MSSTPDMGPCDSVTFDPKGITGTLPAGFLRWYHTDHIYAQTGPPTRQDLHRPTVAEILADPDAWLASLRAHLQMGLDVELFTLPPYLTALLSIREGTNRHSALLIRGVLMEEMLHMTLASNVLNAVGGTPVLASRDVVQTYPSRIPFSGLTLDVPLAAFSQATMCGLRTVETPDELAPKNPGWADDLGFTSIGEFYGVVLDMLWTLTLVLGPQRVFVGDDRRQLAPEHYYGGGGDIIDVPSCDGPVNLMPFKPLDEATGAEQRDVLSECLSLKRAMFAITTIVNQGEGASNIVQDRAFFVGGASAASTAPLLKLSWRMDSQPDDCLPIGDGDTAFGENFEPAHFYKFDEVLKGRMYKQGDCGLHPTGDTFEVDYASAWPMKSNPKAADYAAWPDIAALVNQFNDTFTRLLQLLERALTGEQRVMREAVQAMYELEYQGKALMRLPIPGDPQGRTVGTPFELTCHRAGRRG